MTDDQLQTIGILERFITMKAISKVYIQNSITEVLCNAQMIWAFKHIRKRMPENKHDVLIRELQTIVEECRVYFEKNGVPPKIDDYKSHIPLQTTLRLKDFVIRNNFSMI